MNEQASTMNDNTVNGMIDSLQFFILENTRLHYRLSTFNISLTKYLLAFDLVCNKTKALSRLQK
jgi:hypothetical protein